MNFVTQPRGEQPEEQVQGVSSKKKIGQTQMHNVHARKEHKLILLKSLDQPVGPTEDVVIKLSSFLGTLARNATLCPFDILDWRSMDTKKDLWDYIKKKYIIPEVAQNWALVTIRDAWRRYKSDLKTKYYDAYDNDEIRMAKKSGHILECQFRDLLKYWKSKKFKEKEKKYVSFKELLVVTRTRKPDRLYKASNENTTSKIFTRLIVGYDLLGYVKEIEKQMSINGQSVDAFSVVMDPEHPEHLTIWSGGYKDNFEKEI
uniref:Uncharacterized protein n=1 Tax=Solanum lycopersicum TaxID=4081 RepID=A0A3Q7J5W4_SOLLC